MTKSSSAASSSADSSIRATTTAAAAAEESGGQRSSVMKKVVGKLTTSTRSASVSPRSARRQFYDDYPYDPDKRRRTPATGAIPAPGATFSSIPASADERSCSTLSAVSAGMGDRLWAGIPPRYMQPSQLGQLSLASLWGR